MIPASTLRHAGGHTLLELLCALGIGAVLAAVAVPGYTHVLHKTRRSDATLALLALQMAQERHRAEHESYGSFADLHAADRSASGHYRLVLARVDADGFEIHAMATGTQEADIACRRLTLRVDGGYAVYASGSDAGHDNADAANRRCWSL
jgi:type IV pilus assembly protein PilE